MKQSVDFVEVRRDLRIGRPLRFEKAIAVTDVLGDLPVQNVEGFRRRDPFVYAALQLLKPCFDRGNFVVGNN